MKQSSALLWKLEQAMIQTPLLEGTDENKPILYCLLVNSDRDKYLASYIQIIKEPLPVEHKVMRMSYLYQSLMEQYNDEPPKGLVRDIFEREGLTSGPK